MPVTILKFQRLARWDLEQIPEPEQRAVREAIDTVLSLSPQQWPADRVRPRSPENRQYLLRATPEWCVFFELTSSGEIEVSQVVSEERLRFLRESWRKSGSSA